MSSSKNENIFDLSQLVPKSNDIEVKGDTSEKSSTKKNANGSEMTNDEIIAEMINIKGYTEVPREEWANIPVLTYIRYMKDDDIIAKGGFVDAVSYGINKEGEQVLSLHIRSGKMFRWIIHANTIKHIWKKMSSNGITPIQVQNNTVQPIQQQPNQQAGGYYMPQSSSSNYPAPQDHYTITKDEMRMIKEDIVVNKKTIDLLRNEIQKLQNENIRIVNYLKKISKR